MQRSGVMSQRSLEHYFSRDTATGTPAKCPARSKTIIIGTRKRPVGRPRKAPPAVTASVMPKLVDYSSTDSESSSEGPSTDCPSTKKRIHRMPAEGKTNRRHVVPITTRRSNIAPKWYDNFLARSKHAPVTILNYFFWRVN